MPAGVIHFVTETGQSENGVPGKKRLSRINSHVARFSHNRRKNNKNNNSATVSRTVSDDIAQAVHVFVLIHHRLLLFRSTLSWRARGLMIPDHRATAPRASLHIRYKWSLKTSKAPMYSKWNYRIVATARVRRDRMDVPITN
jgi:hypothetical protein